MAKAVAIVWINSFILRLSVAGIHARFNSSWNGIGHPDPHIFLSHFGWCYCTVMTVAYFHFHLKIIVIVWPFQYCHLPTHTVRLEPYGMGMHNTSRVKIHIELIAHISTAWSMAKLNIWRLNEKKRRIFVNASILAVISKRVCLKPYSRYPTTHIHLSLCSVLKVKWQHDYEW